MLPTKTRRIIVPAGIGDSIWLLQLLINTPNKERFNFLLPGGNPRRGKQVFDLLPQISISCEYSEDRRMGYEVLKRENIQRRFRLWCQIKDHSMFLSANEWLEEGHNLNGFFMDLPTSYTLPWQTSQHQAEAISDTADHPIRIGIYGSSYSTARAWGFWKEDGWLQLIKLLHHQRPNITFYIIGAAWDQNLSDGLVSHLTKLKIRHVNTVGKPLGYVIELMKRLDYAFYFPSGLPILSESLEGKRDCTMFYPKHLSKMIGKWADPKRVEDGSFKEAQFCEPQKIFEWVRNEYKLFDRI